MSMLVLDTRPPFERTSPVDAAGALAPDALPLRTEPCSYAAAYESVAAELASVPDRELEPINLDIAAATTTALGVLPKVLVLRAELVGTLRDFDARALDKLDAYASALFYLHVAYLSSARPHTSLPALAAEAGRMRDLFVAEAEALVLRGLLDASVLRDRPRGRGYMPLMLELLNLAVRLRAKWPDIAGRTGLHESEFGAAEALCMGIQSAMGSRALDPRRRARTHALAQARHRAFTLFHRAYREVRAAVCYLRRRQGDADTIMPSLRAGRGGRGRVRNGAAQA